MRAKTIRNKHFSAPKVFLSGPLAVLASGLLHGGVQQAPVQPERVKVSQKDFLGEKEFKKVIQCNLKSREILIINYAERRVTVELRNSTNNRSAVVLAPKAMITPENIKEVRVVDTSKINQLKQSPPYVISYETRYGVYASSSSLRLDRLVLQ